MLEVDGCEECKTGKGPTMHEMGALMVKLGAVAAVNMDGGGSSTTVIDGKLADWPTNLDNITKSERPVTTILCLTSEKGL